VKNWRRRFQQRVREGLLRSALEALAEDLRARRALDLVERLFAWLQNFRRLVVRYEYHLEPFLGFVHLGCILILLRCYLWDGL
jgi:transposase